MSEQDESIEEGIIHCVYCSGSASQLSADEVLEILETSRINNQKRNITGILLYENGSFFQVLEGKSEIVDQVYQIITKDTRHTNIVKIISEPIEQRAFGDWTMGYASLTRDQLNSIDGLNDFFTQKRSYVDLDEGRAKSLLKSFSDGRWRNSID